MPLLLTPDLIAFLQGPLSMNVGAVGRDGWPCVTRAGHRRGARLVHADGAAVLGAGTGSVRCAGGGQCDYAGGEPAGDHATLQFKAARAERVTLTAVH